MSNIAENLKSIQYQNLEQFIEDINRNFAVIQNSPLYRGIPGKGGNPGTTGLRGLRGSVFVFATLKSFNEQFPGELINASKITLDYINTKMTTFENKQKLLTALGLTELVDKDVIILTNSIMLSYSLATEQFVDTGLAFNTNCICYTWNIRCINT